MAKLLSIIIAAGAGAAAVGYYAYKNRDRFEALLNKTADKIKAKIDTSFCGDANGDGEDDFIVADTNGDGITDTYVCDTTGNGIPDTAFVDTDGDGVLDTAFEVIPEDKE